MDSYIEIQKKATLLRKWSLVSTSEAGSGHPTSCLSAADLTAVLFDKYFTYNIETPQQINNDRFVMSKGHASPLFYALYGMSSAFPLEELMTLRKFTSNLEGHPTPKFPFTDAATGSLGQGLSVGAGMAYLLKQEFPISTFQFPMPKVYVVMGDGEIAEGQVWEAANFASKHSLDNLIAIVDVNRLGQSEETMFGHQVDEYVSRFNGFGFEATVIDGHDYMQIDKALKDAQANTSGRPYVIIAKTFKGKGISFLENQDKWHGKALKKEELANALEELGEVDDTVRFELRKPTNVILEGNDLARINQETDPGQARMTTDYSLGVEIGTREVYGKVLAEIANSDDRIYALDGDMKNSTFSEDFMKAYPDRFIECFIAEQNMVGVAMGLSRLGKKPFVSTFASFLVRAADQIRMARISDSNIAFVGAHAGVSIGEDGPSQMGLEDLSLFGTIPDSIMLHPSDAVSMTKLLPLVASHKGISYLRMLRPKLPVLYEMTEEFTLGGSKVLRQSDNDICTIAATGITVHEAVKAYESLKEEGILVRVVDCYSIKPVDIKTLKLCISETLQPLIISVEDHFEHGGFGDFVQSALIGSNAVIKKLAVTHISRSGTPSELLSDAGIDAASIMDAVKKFL